MRDSTDMGNAASREGYIYSFTKEPQAIITLFVHVTRGDFEPTRRRSLRSEATRS